MKPRIYVERQGSAWAVQELDAPPTTMRFRSKAQAVAEGTREARRLQGEMVVLTRGGRLDRWESFDERPATRGERIGQSEILAG